MSNPFATKNVPGRASGGDTTAQALIALIDEFIAVVREENAMLAGGLPASFAPVSKRKAELADAFEGWVKAAVAREFSANAASPAVRKVFVERLTLFQQVMSENMTRLQAAMEASRRRIDSLMSVIRDEMAGTSSYGANGRTYTVGSKPGLRSGYV